MKHTRHNPGESRFFTTKWSVSFLAICALFSGQALAQTSTVSLYSLPDTSAAAKYVSTITEEALPARNDLSLKERAALSLIEVGFLVGTTTAVHELGHASRVRAMGGQSHWETGDKNWWSYLSHRVPLASGVTEWMVPRIITTDERLLIATAGFNATTLWDESVGGKGPFALFPARYSTLLYAFSGVNSDADDLGQIVQLYNRKGFRISREELQGWQLLAGCIGALNTKVKTYAYFTPAGVSLKTVGRFDDWRIALETVVHGDAKAELELGRTVGFGSKLELLPKVLISESGVGGSLQAGANFGKMQILMKWQRAPKASLLATRVTNSLDLQLASRF